MESNNKTRSGDLCGLPGQHSQHLDEKGANQMSMEQTKHMLETLMYYGDSQITQTFSKNQQKVLSVSYIKERRAFQLTYLTTSDTELYTDIPSTAQAIKKVIDGQIAVEEDRK